MEQDGEILLKMYDPIWQILYIQSTIYWFKYIYRLHIYFQIRAILSKKELRYITLYTAHGIMGQNKTKNIIYYIKMCYVQCTVPNIF